MNFRNRTVLLQILIASVFIGGAAPARAHTAAVLPFWNHSPAPTAAVAGASKKNTANLDGSRQVNPDASGVSGDASHASAANAPRTAANVDWIGESIAQTLREAIASRGVIVCERAEIEEVFHRLELHDRGPLTDASVIKIGEELDAEQVLFGEFRFVAATLKTASASKSAVGAASSSTPAGTAVNAQASAGSLRISARILDRRHMRLGAEFFETGALEDLATLEAHLAWRALTQLAPGIAPPESEYRTLRPAIRLDAEESYVRGLLATDTAQREKFFLQAARLDARFAQPCYQLGQIHYQRKEYRQAADWLERVQPEDLRYRKASFLLGLARFQSGDFEAAQKAFQMIAQTVPLGEVFNNLAAAESRRNLPQSVDDFKKAADADPSDPVYQFNLGYALWKKGDFSEAAERFRAVLSRTPDDPMATLLLGRCLKKQGLHAGALHDADARLASLERLKTEYEEHAYWQLKALMGK